MSTTDYRRQLHDQLITDFGNLTHTDGTSPLFASVEKVYIDYPESTPACRIIPSDTNIDVRGNTSDIRIYVFQSDVFEKIQNSATQSEADNKYDRLSNIEDGILDYLQKLPNNLEYINGPSTLTPHVIQIRTSQARYTHQLTEEGVEIYQSIIFELHVETTPQLL